MRFKAHAPLLLALGVLFAAIPLGFALGQRPPIAAPQAQAETRAIQEEAPVYDATGSASWYGASFHGHRDARGEVFDQNAMTAAHRTLPLNSLVRVTNTKNGRAVLVRITDRGPFAHHRLIDLSRAAADALGYVPDGIARVNVRLVRTAPS